jgi:hypothetical protein
MKRCAFTPRILLLKSRSKPFITPSTIIKVVTPKATPKIQKRVRRDPFLLPRRYLAAIENFHIPLLRLAYRHLKVKKVPKGG